MIENFFLNILGYIFFHPMLPFMNKFQSYLDTVPEDYETQTLVTFFTIYFGIYGYISLKIMLHLNNKYPNINFNSSKTAGNVFVLILKYYFTACVVYLGIAGLCLVGLIIFFIAMFFAILIN